MNWPNFRSLARFLSAFPIRPNSKEKLTALLRRLHEDDNLFDSESLSMLEGVLRISDLRARDVMIPKSEITAVYADDDFEKIVGTVAKAGHSRYPVLDSDDRVRGILLAKDLLRHISEGRPFNLRDLLRPASFEPDSKPLDVLLREFRARRNHMVIVADEYGIVAGLVTIEDVLERIVGEIGDEHDRPSDDGIVELENGNARVRATTPLAEFNQHFGAKISDDKYGTVGGFLLARSGGVPKRGAQLDAYGFSFRVLDADSRRVLAVEVVRKK